MTTQRGADSICGMKLNEFKGPTACACLWVVAHHIAMQFDVSQTGWRSIIRIHGALGVAIFFVLSGMLLSLPFWQAALGERSRPKIGSYTMARLSRIVPGYVLCLLACTFLFADRTAATGWRLLASLTFTNWLHWRTFFPTPVNAPLWSISVEVCFYLILPLWAFGLYRTRRIDLGLAYIFGTQLLIVILQRCFLAFNFAATNTALTLDPLHVIAIDWLPAKNPLGLFAHFLFGTAAAGLLVRWPKRETVVTRSSTRLFNIFDVIVLACLAGMAIDIYPKLFPLAGLIQLVDATHVWYMFYHWPLFPALVTGLLVALHHSRCLGRLFDNPAFEWTAKLSYGIYLWHMVVLELLLRHWPGSLTESLIGQVAYVCAAVAITYSLAAASFYFVEQPVMNRLKRRRESTPANPTPSSDRRSPETGFA